MEDVEMELQALQAVYGDDCRVLESWPPRVELLLKPRTADELSQQFVEIVLGIKASSMYPGEPPAFELVVIKGLDDVRQRNLLAVLNGEADQLRDEPMLVTISESAVDFITQNNYPDGECCFCLMPLMGQAEQPFMKLMTCFHCFHSDCFSRWWNWVCAEDQPVYCPVCRAPIHTEAVAHLQQELLKFTKDPDKETETIVLAAELLESEAQRQAEFSRFFEAQKTRGGIIEPRRALSLSAEQAANETTELQEERTEAVPEERSEAVVLDTRSEQELAHPEQAQASDQAESKAAGELSDPAAGVDDGTWLQSITTMATSKPARRRRYHRKKPANRTAWVIKDP